MAKHLILILTILFVNCKGQTQEAETKLNQENKDPFELIVEKDAEATSKQYDDIGELISTIQFKVKTDDKNFEDGIIPWASIENPLQDIPNLVDKDEIVIKQTSIKVIIDYPLTNQYEFSLISKSGFSRSQLLTEISKHYYKVYEEEEESATIKTIPIDKRTTMYNRNQTNGKYGIWGHDIADLDLSEISFYKTKKGEIIAILIVES